MEERRLYTNAEMIAKSQDNINLQPAKRSLFQKHMAAEVNQKFIQIKLTGGIEEEAQIEKDKAKALSYVLYEKFKKDREDRNIMDAAEFEKLYGMSESEIR